METHWGAGTYLIAAGAGLAGLLGLGILLGIWRDCRRGVYDPPALPPAPEPLDQEPQRPQ